MNQDVIVLLTQKDNNDTYIAQFGTKQIIKYKAAINNKDRKSQVKRAMI